MTNPSQQTMCFPDTIAACLDEDKAVVRIIEKEFYQFISFSFVLVDLFLQ